MPFVSKVEQTAPFHGPAVADLVHQALPLGGREGLEFVGSPTQELGNLKKYKRSLIYGLANISSLMKCKDLSQSLHRQRPLLERRLVLAFRDLPQGRAETGAVEQKSDRKVVLKRTGSQGARGPFGVGLELPNHSGPTRQAQQGAIDKIIESILPQSKRFQRVDDRLDRTAIRRAVLCDQIRKLLEPTWLKNRAYPIELLKQLEQGSIPIRQSPLRKTLVGRAAQKTNQLLVDAHIAIDAVRA